MSRYLLGALLLHGAAAHTNLVGVMPVVDTVDTYHPAYPRGAPAFYSCPSTSAAASSSDTVTYDRDGTDGDSTNVFRAVNNPLKAAVGTDGNDVPDYLAGTVSVGIPGPLCDSAGDGSPDEESFSRQRAPEPFSWAGISTFGFWCCLIALVAVVGVGPLLRYAGRVWREGGSTTLPAAPPRSSVIALFITQGMRALLVFRLAGLALAEESIVAAKTDQAVMQAALEASPPDSGGVQQRRHLTHVVEGAMAGAQYHSYSGTASAICYTPSAVGTREGGGCQGATFSDSASATCSAEDACYQAAFSDSAIATCSVSQACYQAAFSDSAIATCSVSQACYQAAFSDSAIATCSETYACSSATFSGSATATCSVSDACYQATFSDSAIATCSV